MIAALDVHYKENYAKTVLLIFENWTSESYHECIEVKTTEITEYIPGEFYKRELPCLLEGLKRIDLNSIEVIIIDGYIYVDNEGNSGLGGHLYHSLNEQIPIIGVAKTKFANNSETVVEVFRGESKNPLYVSAVGIEKEKAAEQVKKMFGDYRLPHLLKIMDQKTKEE